MICTMRFLKSTSLLLIITVCASCSKEEATPSLNGLYTETSPVPGRSQLNFIDEHTLVKIETEGTTKDTFNYQIEEGIIVLTPSWNRTYTSQLEINVESDSEFEIADLYMSTGLYPPTLMTFEK